MVRLAQIKGFCYHRICMNKSNVIAYRQDRIPGPEFVDFLEFLATRPEDIAVLQTCEADYKSIIAFRPAITVEFTAERQFRIYNPHHLPISMPHSASHPLMTLEVIRGSIEPLHPRHGLALPAMDAGWFGFFGFDIAHLTETLSTHAPDDTRMPLFRWSLYDFYFRFNRQYGWECTYFDWGTSNRPPREAFLEEGRALLAQAKAAPRPAQQSPVSSLIISTARDEYLKKIERAKDYIAAGDVYQVNLAQRWSARTDASPASIYRRLIQESPADFAAFIKFGSTAIISASPELLLQRDGATLITKPIKGTRPRDLADKKRDQQLAQELLSSEKDKAELAMIVDLLRNDLGRVGRFNSIRVREPRTLAQLPTVWHTYATIDAALDPDYSWPELIASLCPGGSVTGAPKIRAMEIIDELESHRRGVYCGNIGYIAGTTGVINVAIRTIQMIGQTAHIWAGGGIVADSVPELEYEETLHKAAAMFRALGLTI